MVIREANAADKAGIIALYEESQRVTCLPDPTFIPPSELGDKLYQRNTIKRYIAIENNSIAGHGIIEEPNPEHIEDWQNAIGDNDTEFIELGAAFVDPMKIGHGIWSSLLIHRLAVARSMGAIPVSVTWSSNLHVKKRFLNLGGREISEKETKAGNISLFVL